MGFQFGATALWTCRHVADHGGNTNLKSEGSDLVKALTSRPRSKKSDRKRELDPTILLKGLMS